MPAGGSVSEGWKEMKNEDEEPHYTDGGLQEGRRGRGGGRKYTKLTRGRERRGEEHIRTIREKKKKR